MRLIDADKLIEKLSAGLDNPEELPVISIGTVMRMIDGEEEVHTSQPEAPCYLGSPCEYQNPNAEIAQLSQEGTTKDATSDTISRQAAIKAVNNAFDRETLLTGFVRSIAVRAIRDMPSAQPEERTKKRTETHTCDCISRKDAIRWIKTECNPYGKPTLDFESGKRVMKHLEQMPPAQPELKWIPVSEKLPEERDWYLGIFKEPDTGWINPTPFICDYLLGTKTKATTKEGWILKGHTDREEYIDYYFNLECVAWMPLPEPYKEGEIT